MVELVSEKATTAAASVASVLKSEKTRANAQMTRIQMRNPNTTYNTFAVKDLTATTPNMNWAMILNDSKIVGADSVVVGNPSFLKTANDMLASVPVQDWKSYQRCNLIKSAAPYLSSDFVKADF